VKYIPDVDEMVMPSPFRLGVKPHYETQGHTFVVAAEPVTLQRLLNRHVNVPLGCKENDPNDPWNLSFGNARQRTCNAVSPPQKIMYVVLKDLKRVLLNVLRYRRVDAQRMPEKGYIAYTEVLFQFLIHRILEAEPLAPKETYYFLGAVYIDDSAFRGEVQDPESLPILLGREAYGLPKNPGQIHYCPQDANTVLGPRLNVWDYDATTVAKLALQPALTVNPATWTSPPSDYCPSEVAPVRANTRYGPLSAQLRIPETALDLRPFDDPGDPFREHARILTLPSDKVLVLPRRQMVREIVIRNDLYLFAKLVGLKQFPEPTSDLPPGPNAGVDACYQAVVESAVEHAKADQPVYEAVVGQQVIEFHPLARVDLARAFGITLDAQRRVEVPAGDAFYMVSNLLFGRACRSEVWEAE
jgi:hypothetical protein